MNSALPSPRLMVASALAFALHFLALPQLDLIANGSFYDPQHGFLLQDSVLFGAVHKFLGILVAVLLAWSATVWALSLPAHAPEKWRARRPAALFLALVLLLGPGVLVNGIFKDHWGRARPAQISQFGGKATFTPSWVMSKQCDKNCSFVCGDASMGYAVLAIAFVSRRPRFWFAAGLTLGSALGLMRMGQGGHFLSDVVFSFYAVYFTAWALWRFMTRAGRVLSPLD